LQQSVQPKRDITSTTSWIRFVSQKSKDNGNLQSPSSGDYKEGLNESDYNKHEDHAEEEQQKK